MSEFFLGGRVRLEPKGHRDVYWCHINNEPGVLEYRDGVPYCTNCEGNPLEPCVDGTPNPIHTFVVGIGKPPYGPCPTSAPTKETP
jgi:hypothetical protein